MGVGSNTMSGDLNVQGTLTANTAILPASCVNNTSVAALAAISASKLQHDHRQVYAQESATTAAAEARVIFVAVAAGTVNSFSAGSVVVSVGAATATVDLKKNGSSILSAVITLDNANVARVAEAGTITTPSFVAGDVFEVVITATAGGGTICKGLFAAAQFFEVSQ